MTDQLTLEEFLKTQIFVHSFNKIDESTRQIIVRVVYEGEMKLFTEVVSSLNKKRGKQWYVQKAFKRSRKDIRKWVKEQEVGGAVVGKQISFPIEIFNNDEDENIDEPAD